MSPIAAAAAQRKAELCPPRSVLSDFPPEAGFAANAHSMLPIFSVFMTRDLYLWRSKISSTTEFDSLPQRFAPARMNEAVMPFERRRVMAVFQRHFPRLKDLGHHGEWEDRNGHCEIHFNCDGVGRVTSIRVSFETSPAARVILRRFFNAAAELDCRIYDVRKATLYTPSTLTAGWRGAAARLLQKKWLKAKARESRA